MGFKNTCLRGSAMNPKTVTIGHVNTRVCFLGSDATAAHQARIVSASCPVRAGSRTDRSRTGGHLRIGRRPQCDLLEGKHQVGARLDRYRYVRDIVESAVRSNVRKALACCAACHRSCASHL
jgi:hypothetical protein